MTLTAPPVIDSAPSVLVEPTVVPVSLKGAVVGRRVEVWEAYKAYQATAAPGCGFCATPAGEVVEERGTVKVIVNLFPYAAWDGLSVVDHLMIVPARHLLSKAEFTGEESADWWMVAAEYEARGYSVYTRSPDNASRSVAHLHTHLIRAYGPFTG
jgi:diadenosine tetraphosphate (Ap4A) HIT family hydrolase